jgi:hypothetical protein
MGMLPNAEFGTLFSAFLRGRGGDPTPPRIVFVADHHPVCAAKDAAQLLLIAQPPLLEEEGKKSATSCFGSAASFTVKLPHDYAPVMTCRAGRPYDSLAFFLVLLVFLSFNYETESACE